MDGLWLGLRKRPWLRLGQKNTPFVVGLSLGSKGKHIENTICVWPLARVRSKEDKNMFSKEYLLEAIVTLE